MSKISRKLVQQRPFSELTARILRQKLQGEGGKARRFEI